MGEDGGENAAVVRAAGLSNSGRKTRNKRPPASLSGAASSKRKTHSPANQHSKVVNSSTAESISGSPGHLQPAPAMPSPQDPETIDLVSTLTQIGNLASSMIQNAQDSQPPVQAEAAAQQASDEDALKASQDATPAASAAAELHTCAEGSFLQGKLRLESEGDLASLATGSRATEGERDESPLE